MNDPVAVYLAAVPEGLRPALIDIRARIAAALDDMAVPFIERLSYAMPGFEVRGKMIAGYAAHKHKCGFYPHSGTILPRLVAEIGARGHTRSALHFTPNDPIPDPLLRQALALRLDEIGGA